MTEISIPKTKNVLVSELTVDGKNPNFMTDEKFNALKANLQRYGFIIPIITNNKLVVADGEHRLKAAVELGMSEVPVVQLEIDEIDRRLLRQILNKLKGEHDHLHDSNEYLWLVEQGHKEDLKELLAVQDKDIDDLLLLQASEEALLEKMRSKRDAESKDVHTFSFSVRIEDKELVEKALKKTGYKVRDKSFVKMCEEYLR